MWKVSTRTRKKVLSIEEYREWAVTELYKRGMGIKKIAKHLGLSYYNIKWRVNKIRKEYTLIELYEYIIQDILDLKAFEYDKDACKEILGISRTRYAEAIKVMKAYDLIPSDYKINLNEVNSEMVDEVLDRIKEDQKG